MLHLLLDDFALGSRIELRCFEFTHPLEYVAKPCTLFKLTNRILKRWLCCWFYGRQFYNFFQSIWNHPFMKTNKQHIMEHHFLLGKLQITIRRQISQFCRSFFWWFVCLFSLIVKYISQSYTIFWIFFIIGKGQISEELAGIFTLRIYIWRISRFWNSSIILFAMKKMTSRLL